MTVGELKGEIAEIPDNTTVILLSDSGSLDSVFGTYDEDARMYILDGAYRKGAVAVQPDLLNYSRETK